MMPHPTTMAFAWEKELQRCARILICVFLFALVALIGASVLVGGAQDTRVVAEEMLEITPAFEAESSDAHDYLMPSKLRTRSLRIWSSTAP